MKTAPANGANRNPFFAIVDADPPVITKTAALPLMIVRVARTVDIATVAGTTYVITVARQVVDDPPDSEPHGRRQV